MLVDVSVPVLGVVTKASSCELQPCQHRKLPAQQALFQSILSACAAITVHSSYTYLQYMYVLLQSSALPSCPTRISGLAFITGFRVPDQFRVFALRPPLALNLAPAAPAHRAHSGTRRSLESTGGHWHPRDPGRYRAMYPSMAAGTSHPHLRLGTELPVIKRHWEVAPQVQI